MTDKYEQLGFVTLDDIMNVFTTKKTELVEKIIPWCPTIEARGDTQYVLDLFDSIRGELMRRARDNVRDYISKSPVMKQEDRERQAKESEDRNRMNYEERIRRSRSQLGLG
jgi:hypothetical protein